MMKAQPTGARLARPSLAVQSIVSRDRIAEKVITVSDLARSCRPGILPIPDTHYPGYEPGIAGI
jgi:hypothetical protein